MHPTQREYGNERLKECADKWGVSEKTAATIILDVGTVKEFWQWVNAETFLYDVVHHSSATGDGCGG